MAEPFPVVSVAEMRALEAAAVEAGTPERVLQERAGLAVADEVEGLLGERRQGASVLVLVGAGNNGRDGVVAGRRLAARGCDVALWLGPRHALSDGELRDLAADGVSLRSFADPHQLEVLRAALRGADVVVDALLGVSARGPMRPDLSWAAALVNRTTASPNGPKVVAVDLPSGIGADDGSAPGEVVRADVTVTFGAVKAGLLCFPAADFVGRLVVRSIGLPTGSADRFPVHVLNEQTVRSLVPARPLDAHKYRFGRVLVIAGSDRYVGAACLGSEAAARAGAGLIGVVSTEAVKRVLATRLPEAIYPDTLEDVGAASRAGHGRASGIERTVDRVVRLLPDQAAVLLGPGIDRSEAIDELVRRLLAANAGQTRPVPAVIDADALSLLAGWPGWWERIGGSNVLTPHAGEMARLLASDPTLGRIDGEPAWQTALRAAVSWGQIVVLKGPFTVVAAPSGRAWIYPHANAALATAGTGDVLAGLIAGLLAQLGSPVDAARLAVVVHAQAAHRVLSGAERRTLVASDLPNQLPAVLAALASTDRRR